MILTKNIVRSHVRTWLGMISFCGISLCTQSVLAQKIDNPGYAAYTNVNSLAISSGSISQASIPPSGYWHSVDSGSQLYIQYLVDSTTSGGPYLKITLSNPIGASTANYALHGANLTPAAGDVLRSTTDLIITKSTSHIAINSGFYFQKDSAYAGQFESETSIADGARRTLQSLNAEYVGGTTSLLIGAAPNQAHGILSAYNIQGGEVVELLLKGWKVDKASIPSNGILPLPIYGYKESVNKNAKITVSLLGKNFSGDYTTNIELIDGSGLIKANASHKASTYWSSNTGRIFDSFLIDLSPLNLSGGDYSIRYSMSPTGTSKGIRLGLANTAAIEKQISSTSSPDYRYLIGSINLSKALGGAQIGMSYHHYPGTSDSRFGAPIQYSFARSLASDQLWKPWWDVNYDGTLNMSAPGWANLDAWANKFSTENSRSLLVTFYGSPKSASSQPNVISPAWGAAAPGITAPPKDLTTFQAAVRETVKRLSGRIFAVECWNEPNSSDMFTGTPTELADICKNVYIGAKSIDNTIPVICPQADSPNAVGYIYSAMTSDGQPITKYCDWVGAHIYNRLGLDSKGKAYSVQSLGNAVKLLQLRSQQYGLTNPLKKLAITEFGVERCTWNTMPAYGRVQAGQTLDDLSDADKGDAIFSAVTTMFENSAKAIGLYSYDHGDDNPTCRRGGSYIWSTSVDAYSNQYLNSTVLDSITQSRAKVGTLMPAIP